MRFFGRRAPTAPELLLVQTTGRGEQVLAYARCVQTSQLAVATTHRLVAVSPAPDAQVLLDRPWHEVDAASWDGDTETLTVTFVDAGGPARTAPVRWSLVEDRTLLAVIRERVQASVIMVEHVTTSSRVQVRLALRQNLATGEVVEQALGRRPGDLNRPGVADEVARRLQDLRADLGP